MSPILPRNPLSLLHASVKAALLERLEFLEKVMVVAVILLLGAGVFEAFRLF